MDGDWVSDYVCLESEGNNFIDHRGPLRLFVPWKCRGPAHHNPRIIFFGVVCIVPLHPCYNAWPPCVQFFRL